MDYYYWLKLAIIGITGAAFGVKLGRSNIPTTLGLILIAFLGLFMTITFTVIETLVNQ